MLKFHHNHYKAILFYYCMKKSLLAGLWSLSLIGTAVTGWYANDFYNHYQLLQLLKIKKSNPSLFTTTSLPLSIAIPEKGLPKKLTQELVLKIPLEADYTNLVKDGVYCAGNDGHTYNLRGNLNERKVILMPK